MQIQDVEITKLESDCDQELSSDFYKSCSFCNKLVRVTEDNFKSCIRLSGTKFHCPFCIRNNFNYKSNRNVLIMSFRAIFGYYYYKFYDQNPHKIWYSQISHMIDKHMLIGLQNPVFSYDSSTFLWFVDFNKIGRDKHKAPFKEVCSITKKIFLSLEMKKHITELAEAGMWEKYDKAIKLFYTNRKRPSDRRMLIPTLYGTVKETDEFFEDTRIFTKKSLILK